MCIYIYIYIYIYILYRYIDIDIEVVVVVGRLDQKMPGQIFFLSKSSPGSMYSYIYEFDYRFGNRNRI